MHPEWRLILDLDDQRTADDDGAGNHDDEDGGAVAGVDKGIVEPAGFTPRPQRQEPRIQLAFAAARTFAGDAAHRALRYRGELLGWHGWSFANGETKGAALRPPSCSTMNRD